MRTEKEIRDKLESMTNMYEKVRTGLETHTTVYLKETLQSQIDMLLWMLEDESGLPPIDEDEMYACFK